MNMRDTQPVDTPDYRLIRRIGASPATSVYAATELASGNALAIKVFHRVDADVFARLEKQLQANAELVHPNIVRVHGTGRTRDGRLFYSMPLLTGLEELRANLLGRPLRIARPLRDVLAGLAYAHQRGVVHGDIKSPNVLFDEQGRAQLADFGIARCMAAAPGDPPNVHSDLRAVGMLAYELIAGAAAIPNGAAAPRLPPGTAAWQAWLDRALTESPQQGFQNAQEMSDALDAITGPARRGPDFPPAAPVQPERAPKKLPIAAIVITAIVVSAAWAWWGYQRVPGPASENVPAAASAPNPTVTTAASVANPAVTAASIANPAVTAAASATNPAVATTSSAANPAFSATAAQPAPASSVVADRVQALVSTADALRARGHVFSPPFHNAASTYLAAIMLDPGNPAAIKGIDATLIALRARLDRTWRDGRDTTGAVDMLRQGDELSKHADASARRDWRRYRGRLARQVGDADARAADAHDRLVLAALQPLAKALHVLAPGALDPASSADAPTASTPTAGAHLRDPHGPLLVYVPAEGKLPAFAIQQTEVTRADYAAFVHATHRAAARCAAAHNPFSRLRGLTWQAPGFAQTGDHPVVCVSWRDAEAYVTWLSKRTGEPYRLPNNEQWLRAARGMPKESPCKLGNVDDVSRRTRWDNDRLTCDDGAEFTAPVGRYAASGVGAYDMYGNVSEWLAGGGGSHAFRGLSWRDGSHETALGSHGTAGADIGYTSVGFRVVRVIDAAHPAPAAVAGH